MKKYNVIALLCGALIYCVGCKDEPTQGPVNIPLSLSVDTVFSPTSDDLYSISFPTTDTGYAVGRFGRIIKTTDEGTSWNMLSSPAPVEDASAMRCVFFWNALEGIVGSDKGVIYRTSDGGSAWDTIYSSDSRPSIPFNCEFFSFAGDPSTELFAWGTTGSSQIMLVLYRSTDSGLSWSPTKTGRLLIDATDVGQEATCFVSSAGKFVTSTSYRYFGHTSDILISTDPDSSWSVAYSSWRNFYGVEFLSSSYLMSVGDSGWVNRSTDGGTTWALDSTGAQGNLRAVAASGSGRVLVVGDSTVMTASGSPWSLSTLGTTFGPLTAVKFVSANHAIAVGKGGRIYSFNW